MSIGKIIVLGIGIFIVASLLPDAIVLLEGYGTGNWSAATVALWTVVSLVALVAVIYYVLPPAWRGGK